MTVTFAYFFDMFFFTNLVEGIALILLYSMFILSSRNQPRENKSDQLLKRAGIIGIIFSVFKLVRPTIVCTPPDYGVCRIYGFSVGLISFVPVLVCLGASLFLLGKRNKEKYGQILIASGILWIVAFFGYAIGLGAIMFGMWMLISFGFLSYLSIPAVILMIIHGTKFTDKYFVLAGFFYIISWLAVILIPWLPIPLI